MFTGIVEATGLIREVRELETTRRFWVEAPELARQLRPGDSVAVDGACLTVAETAPDRFALDVIGTTLARTVAAYYEEGTRVNLERAMRADSRIDGHLVQGHIDGIGYLVRGIIEGEFRLMDFRLPEDVARMTVERGSIAINGVSLTVSELLDDDTCRVGLIPFTDRHTNLGDLRDGARVNVEGDLIGKYVGKVLAERSEGSQSA